MSLFSLLGVDRWVQSMSDHMRQAMAEGSGALEARVLLAKLEWAEEKRRLQQLAVLGLLCIGLLFGLLMGISLAVVVCFWDTSSRITATWCVALFWGVLFVISLVGLMRAVQRAKASFALTKQELIQDWDALKERL